MLGIYKKNIDKTLEAYELYWEQTLERALFPIAITGYESKRSKPKHLQSGQPLFADTAVTPYEIIDCIDYELSTTEFLGDFFPHCNMVFTGPGIVAAFLGAEVLISEGNIWFNPKGKLELKDLHFEYDANNYWLNRCKEIIQEGKKRWGNEVVISLPDLGGVADVLATFRGTEDFLYDLYDEPNEVIRVINEISELWFVYYDELSKLCANDSIFSNWSGIISKTSTYMFQSDFCYMLGNDMFNEFIKPDLKCSFEKTARSCYHLDGVGQLTHLDSLLQIDSLKLVQWVPGAGATDLNHWIDVYDKVLNSGKLLQVVHSNNDTSLKQLDTIIEKRGSLKGVVHGLMRFDKSQREVALKLLDKYEIE